MADDTDRADATVERLGARVLQFACLHDNYGFLLRCEATGTVAAIDTPDGDEVARRVEAWSGGAPRLDLILNTHWHPDHTGGNEMLTGRFGVPIIGPADEADRIPGLTRPVSHSDEVRVGDLTARVIATPGHTKGHVAYHFEDQGLAFVGDTVFSLGCGRLFEGDAAQMWQSVRRLRALPDDTLLLCAHEYTRNNADFALSVEPDHEGLRERSAEVDALRSDGQPTVPVRLGDERAVNPFLRADDPALAAAVGLAGAAPQAVFAELRTRKDRF